MSDRISFKALRDAEIYAQEHDVHIRSCIRPDGGELEIVTLQDAEKLVRKRPVNSHKGTFGRLLCIAGSDRFPGAAQLCTLAALRSGVGIVNLFSTEPACRAATINMPEATLTPLPSDESGYIAADERAMTALYDEIDKSTAVLIGCGMGKSDNALKILKAVILRAACPVIIDADGINLVSGCIQWFRKARTESTSGAELIFTPHPAELARLAGVSTGEAIADRYRIAKRLSQELGAVVVAKSSATIAVSGSSGYVMMFGNDGLAKGGSGDMLAGLTASFAAQGLKVCDAARLSPVILGMACEEVSAELSTTGMLARDILSCLPKLFKKFERA